jgi:predicted methyltransferase
VLAAGSRSAAAPTPSAHAARPPQTPSDRATATHSFADVGYWSRIFDDPKRDAWQKPREIVAALGLAPGSTVADLGAGTGYLTPYLSTAVGPAGTVLAMEVEPTLVTHLRQRAEQDGLANVVPILGSTDNPRLPAHAVDVLVILDTFHHLDHRRAYLPGLRASLIPGGRIAVLDWREGELPEGPPPDHKLPRQQVIDEMRAAGFALAAEHDFLPYHYFLIFE